jgi:DNA-binding GntR family transcriptional regulator
MTQNCQKTLAEKTADKIRELIQKNTLEGGAKLIEIKLCKQIGVSRTPLREALRALSAEGLVDIHPNRGAIVADISLEELRHTFEVMSILEGSCARLAAERLTNADLAELEKLHEKLEEHYRDNDPHAYVQDNRCYHEFIQEKTGNPVLSRIVSELWGRIQLHRFRQIYQPGRLDGSMDEHRELMEAFRAREAGRAEKLMQLHLKKQCDALVMYYAELGRSVVSEELKNTKPDAAKEAESPKSGDVQDAALRFKARTIQTGRQPIRMLQHEDPGKRRK